MKYGTAKYNVDGKEGGGEGLTEMSSKWDTGEYVDSPLTLSTELWATVLYHGIVSYCITELWATVPQSC